jgi:ABC-2 type transport system permease protein
LSSRRILATTAGVMNLVFFLLLLLMLIFASGSYLFQSTREEKASRIIEIVLSSVSANALLAGKVVGLTALTLTQVGVWLLLAFVFSGGILALVVAAVIALNPTSFLLGMVYCGLGYLIYAIIMATIGAGISNFQENQSLLVVFIMLPLLSAYLGLILLVAPEISNSLFLRLLSFFPFTTPMIMTIRLAAGDVPIIDIIGSIAVLLLTNAFVLWAGVKVFRASLLMYGKRPTIKQVVQMLKSA